MRESKYSRVQYRILSCPRKRSLQKPGFRSLHYKSPLFQSAETWILQKPGNSDYDLSVLPYTKPGLQTWVSVVHDDSSHA